MGPDLRMRDGTSRDRKSSGDPSNLDRFFLGTLGDVCGAVLSSFVDHWLRAFRGAGPSRS